MNMTQLLVNISANDPNGSILTICQKGSKQTGRILFFKKIYFIGSMFTGNTPKIDRFKSADRSVIKCIFDLEEGDYNFQYKIREQVMSELISVCANCCNIIDFYVFD